MFKTSCVWKLGIMEGSKREEPIDGLETWSITFYVGEKMGTHLMTNFCLLFRKTGLRVSLQ